MNVNIIDPLFACGCLYNCSVWCQCRCHQPTRDWSWTWAWATTNTLLIPVNECKNKNHKRYQAKRKPTSGCEACWRYYVKVHP